MQCKTTRALKAVLSLADRISRPTASSRVLSRDEVIYTSSTADAASAKDRAPMAKVFRFDISFLEWQTLASQQLESITLGTCDSFIHYLEVQTV